MVKNKKKAEKVSSTPGSGKEAKASKASSAHKELEKKEKAQASINTEKKRLFFTKSERNWILYDVGQAALTMFNTTIVPIYAASLAVAGTTSADIVSSWGITQTIASLIVALLMPILGSLADYKGQKIKFFTAFFLTSIVACAAEVLPLSYVPFLVIYVICIVGLNSSKTFYDSMLIDVTTDKRMNGVSSFSFALGYVTSVVPFAASIALIFLGPQFLPFDKAFCTRLGFGITALWWVAFALPLLLGFKQKYGKKKKPLAQQIQKTFSGLIKTMKTMFQDKRLFYFLLAFFFYIDAVYTVIAMATNYGSAVGIDETHLIFALLATQFVAFPSTILYGLLANKFGTKKMIIVGIVGYIVIVFYAAFWLTGPFQFWILAFMVGLFQGGIQALSRSYFGQIIPKKKSNEYFGFFNVFGAFARVAGTGLVSFFSFVTGNPGLGVFSIAILLVFGLVFMLLMPKEGQEGERSVS